MFPKKGKIVLMGSGELTATMVEVHKGLLDQLPGSAQATFLDTPAGFQLNVDQISNKAVEYFRVHVRQPMSVSSFKSHETITDFDARKTFHRLRQSNYILIGPGSPTYAVRHLKKSPIPDILVQSIQTGGCLVAASAAALTVGRWTLPVYEIYKVGQELHWIDGMDILGQFGFDLVVVPHWNNAEGGTHDTRFCFMGEPRFRQLESLFPQKVPVLGLDEHTACILDFENEQAEIKGIGQVTLRSGGQEVSFQPGDRLPLGVLKDGETDSDWRPDASQSLSPQKNSAPTPDSFWDQIHALEASFHKGLEEYDHRTSTNALLELDRIIWRAQHELESVEDISQARDTLRDLIVLTGNELTSSPRNQAECLAPLVETLLELRQQFREKKQWAEADAIRDALQSVQIAVEDAKNKSKWRVAP
jgi:hypothetical protein